MATAPSVNYDNGQQYNRTASDVRGFTSNVGSQLSAQAFNYLGGQVTGLFGRVFEFA